MTRSFGSLGQMTERGAAERKRDGDTKTRAACGRSNLTVSDYQETLAMAKKMEALGMIETRGLIGLV